MCMVTRIEHPRSPYERWAYKSSLYVARVWRPLDMRLAIESHFFKALVLVIMIAGAVFIGFGLLYQSPTTLLTGTFMIFSRLYLSVYIQFRLKTIRSQLARVREVCSIEGLQRVRSALVTEKRRCNYPSHLVELGVLSQKSFDYIQSGAVEMLREILSKDYPLNEDGTKNLS